MTSVTVTPDPLSNLQAQTQITALQNVAMGDIPRFPSKIQSLITEYLTDRSLPYALPSPFLPRIKAMDSQVLSRYMPDQGDSTIDRAVQVAGRIFERDRDIQDAEYGQSFPMYPEILSYAMENAAGKTVLEIGAASGENAILLACANAARVYVNDISAEEMNTFRNLRDELARPIKKRLIDVEGSCFDLLKLKPEMAGQVDLIVCRNLIHFFNDQQQAQFFDLVSKILKPGGKIILSVNSNYKIARFMDPSVFENHPETTTFRVTQCFLHDYIRYGIRPFDVVFNDVSPESNDFEDAFKPNIKYLYRKSDETENKWVVDNEAYNAIPSQLKLKIKEAVNNSKNKIKKIIKGSVRVLSNILRAYDQENFRRLVEKHGFEVETPFVVDKSGHLVHHIDPSQQGFQVGAIIKRKS